MSDLQTSLLVIGAFVVAGVYLLNSWQERQFRRRAELAFAREHDDILLKGAAAAEDDAGERVEPRLQAAGITPPAPAPVVAGPPAVTMIDPVIDYVVEVNTQPAADAADLHEELLALAAGWGKLVQVSGYAPGTGEWRAAGVGSDMTFAQMRFALQMSNRAGCVEQSQLTAFRDAVLKWAQAAHGEVKCLDLAEAHAMAVQLDRFCAHVDIAIGINVVTRNGNPFSGTKIRALAEAAGLKLEPDGVFYAYGERDGVLFTLDNHEPMPFMPEQMKTLFTSGITFLLDVPRVEDALRAFDAMLEMARTFAAALGGALVDDNRAALSDAAIAKIRQQLESILARMKTGQIAAGGARALRLFS